MGTTHTKTHHMFASRITAALLLLALVALPTQAACNRRASFHQHHRSTFAYDADVEAAVEQISDLRSHISELRSELLESKAQTLDLKQKLAASQTTTTTPQAPTQTSIPVPAAPLSPGSRGAEVAQLQDALVAAGYMNANHPFIRMGRGMFGPYTTSTVAAVQRNELKVEATGTYDDAVRTLLLSKLSTPPAAATEASNNNTEPSPRPAAAAAWRRMGISTCLRSCLAKKQAAASAEHPTEAPAVAPEQAPAVKEEAVKEEAAKEKAVKEDVNEKNQPLTQQQATVWPLDEPLGSRSTAAVAASAQTQEVDAATTRKTLLLELGFDAAEVESALEATQGSLENAAEWLFVNWKKEAKEEPEPAPEPPFPEQWLELVRDLEEMGFEESKAKSALLQSDGSLKDAVKVLVVLEREGSSKSA